jgi:hypothetical protein
MKLYVHLLYLQHHQQEVVVENLVNLRMWPPLHLRVVGWTALLEGIWNQCHCLRSQREPVRKGPSSPVPHSRG